MRPTLHPEGVKEEGDILSCSSFVYEKLFYLCFFEIIIFSKKNLKNLNNIYNKERQTL